MGWSEQSKMAPPLPEEQGRCHFVLQLIPDVGRNEGRLRRGTRRPRAGEVAEKNVSTVQTAGIRGAIATERAAGSRVVGIGGENGGACLADHGGFPRIRG